MPDRDPFELPSEREVSPELRARVLERALSTDTAVRRRRRWVMPIAAGLAATAVVFAVLVVVNRGGSEAPVGPTASDDTQPTVAQVVPDHTFVNLDAGRMSDAVRLAAREACQSVLPPQGKQAAHVLASRRMQGPDGLIAVVGYDNPVATAPYQQYFCTPWGVLENPQPRMRPAPEFPIEAIEGSRQQGLLEAPDGSGGQVYYEGVWFVTDPSVDAVEARVVVDDVPGEWYRSRRNSEYMYASVWQELSPAQLAGDVDVEVEYRALNPDRAKISVPGLSSTTVALSSLPELTEQVDMPTLTPAAP
jgi:hypothetical protein